MGMWSVSREQKVTSQPSRERISMKTSQWKSMRGVEDGEEGGLEKGRQITKDSTVNSLYLEDGSVNPCMIL